MSQCVSLNLFFSCAPEDCSLKKKVIAVNYQLSFTPLETTSGVKVCFEVTNVFEAAFEALFGTSSRTLGSSAERSDRRVMAPLWYVLSGDSLQVPVGGNHLILHGPFTLPRRHVNLAPPSEQLEVFHLQTSRLCGADTEALRSVTPLQNVNMFIFSHIILHGNRVSLRPKQLHLQTSPPREGMQTSDLPSEATQSVCRNQYRTPSCRPIVPRLS